MPLTAVFLVWTGRVLSAHRVTGRALLPFAVLAALLSALYSLGAGLYLPRLFDSYATRYGPLGAVFALITALFGAMLTVVGSCAAGREVHDELDRIAQGQVPPDDDVRQEWANVVDQARQRWQTAREELARRQARRHDQS